MYRSAMKNRKAIQVATKQSKASKYNQATIKRSYNIQVNSNIMVVVALRNGWVGSKNWGAWKGASRGVRGEVNTVYYRVSQVDVCSVWL